MDITGWEGTSVGDPVTSREGEGVVRLVGASAGTLLGGVASVEGTHVGVLVGNTAGMPLGGADGTDSVGKGVGMPLEKLGCTVGTKVGLWVGRRCGD